MTVGVLPPSATQAILVYNAPDSQPCTIRVSENPSLAPLVHDVDPALFPGADRDDRNLALSQGTSRVFIVGKRVAEKAADGRYYSRALQTNTVHYYSVTCNGDAATGQFQTDNIPLGMTYSDALPANFDIPGEYGWPTLIWSDPNQTVIDPQTGVLVRHWWNPQDGHWTAAGVAFASCREMGNGWSISDKCPNDLASPATYNGTGQDPLLVQFGDLRGNADPVNFITAHLAGQGTIEVCLTADGLQCDSATPWQKLTLTPSGASVTVCDLDHPCPPGGRDAVSNGALLTSGSGPSTDASLTDASDCSRLWAGDELIIVRSGNYWPRDYPIVQALDCSGTPPTVTLDRAVAYNNNGFGYPFRLHAGLYANFHAGLLIRSAPESPSSITLQSASFDIGSSAPGRNSSSGSEPVCGSDLYSSPYDNGGNSASGGTEFYLCSNTPYNGHEILYGIEPKSGDTRILGNSYCSASWIPHFSDGSWVIPDAPCRGGYNIGDVFRSTARPYPDDKEWSGKRILYSVSYTGGPTHDGKPVDPDTSAYTPQDITVLTPPDAGDFITLVHRRATELGVALPANWDEYFGRGCNASGGGGPYLMIACPAARLPGFDNGDQNRIGWLVVFDVGNGKPFGHGWQPTDPGRTNPVVGLTATWDKPGCRWCGFHVTAGGSYSSDIPVFVFGASGFPATYWPQGYHVTAQNPLPACHYDAPDSDPQRCQKCPTDIAVSTESAGKNRCGTLSVTSAWDNALGPRPAAFRPGEPVNNLMPTAAWPPWLQTAQPGDTIGDGHLARGPDEYMQIVKKIPALDGSHIDWVVVRGDSSHNHPAGEFYAMVYGNWTVYWDAKASPDAGDPANFFGQKVEGGHAFLTGGWRGEYTLIRGSLADKSTWRSKPIYDVVIGTAPSFAGAKPPGEFGEYMQRHPSYLNYNAPALEHEWFADQFPFNGSDIGDAIQLGKNLYKFTRNAAWGPLARKQLATLASCGNRLLRDISGPESVIRDEMSDAYTYCVAAHDGECMTGSKAQDIYVNCPGLDAEAQYCRGDEFWSGERDVCVDNFGMLLMGAAQVGLAAYENLDFNSMPLQEYTPGGWTHILDEGGHYMRVLARVFAKYRQLGGTANTKPFADGSWLQYFVLTQDYGDIKYPDGSHYYAAPVTPFLVKVPPLPYPGDGKDRTTFMPVKVDFTPPSSVSGMTNALVQFGYVENGDAFWCTSRHEACVIGQTPPNGDPFFFASEATSASAGLPCMPGQSCSITVPGLPQHLIHLQVIYRDQNGQVLGKGPVQVGVTDYAPPLAYAGSNLALYPPISGASASGFGH